MGDTRNDGIDLLDILVFLAERWVVLTVIPLLVAGIAFAYAQSKPPIYTASTSIDFSGFPDESQLAQAARAVFDHPVSASIQNDVITIKASGTSWQEAEAKIALAYGAATAPATAFAQEQRHSSELRSSEVEPFTALSLVTREPIILTEYEPRQAWQFAGVGFIGGFLMTLIGACLLELRRKVAVSLSQKQVSN